MKKRVIVLGTPDPTLGRRLAEEVAKVRLSDVIVSVCSCEMPAKVKGKNECWRCKRPLKEFLQTER